MRSRQMQPPARSLNQTSTIWMRANWSSSCHGVKEGALAFAGDSLPIALQQSALVSFELRARRAHQVTSSASPQALEIFFAHNATIKNPHPPGTAVFALHALEHIL